MLLSDIVLSHVVMVAGRIKRRDGLFFMILKSNE